ncbi:MAG: GxxExxY protein [Ginsengibacter sp.]
MMSAIILKEESYKIVGLCMEVHTELGMGFKEIVYKDAMEYEFTKNNIPFRREKRYEITYKGIILPHSYSADFIVYESIILEVKATSMIVNNFVRQTINYLKASGLQLGIIANFGEKSFTSKRVVF